MRKTLRTAAMASAAALIAVGATAVPASAAEMQPMSKHTGSAGCVNWSWADGWTTTTVYYHSTCSQTWWVNVEFNHDTTKSDLVAPGGKGSLKGTGSFKDMYLSLP